MKIQRALISTYKKDGIVAFGRRLREQGVEILSSGGTARLLASEGVAVTPVDEVTGFPEMLDGRVKTLHPRIHGGILARRDLDSHQTQLRDHGIRPIDLVVVNLYPFEETVHKAGVQDAEVIEMIDIGGPSMIRSAAKNHAHVGVVVDPTDYGTVLAEIESSGGLSSETCRRLAGKAFRHTCEYDGAIHHYLDRQPGAASGDATASEAAPPEQLVLRLERAQVLRYGENPHQRAAFYHDAGDVSGTLAAAEVLQGKELSFNNLLDLDAALALVREFSQPAAAIIKHSNPCGVAVADRLAEAYGLALETDPVSAFGSIVALNREADGETVERMLKGFVEAVVAPSYSGEALDQLSRKKNLRVLRLDVGSEAGGDPWEFRRIRGGFLVQDWDHEPAGQEWKVVTRRKPSAAEERALEFAWKVATHVKSNAIVFTSHEKTLGIGAGQMSRVDSVVLARRKAQSTLEGSVLASDAFFPFRDGVDAAAEAGATAVIQPGGSIRDEEVVAAADEHDIAMVFTGNRHFRH
jgi:phosphoribosylaminoimidazolecarboxamide formyltransferase/IMP cyclohydrolase